MTAGQEAQLAGGFADGRELKHAATQGELKQVTGMTATARAEADAFFRSRLPRARPGDRGLPRHRADPHHGLRLRQRRDLRPVPGVGPRLRRVRAAEPHRPDQPVDHGAADHGGCAQTRVGQAHHRRGAVLRLRPPGQEEPRPGADLGPADGRPVPDRRCRPADGGRPAHRADPGFLRRPGRPPVRAADPGLLPGGQARRLAGDRGGAGRRPGPGLRALDRPARLPAGDHPQAPRPGRGQPGQGARGRRRRSPGGPASWSTT